VQGGGQTTLILPPPPGLEARATAAGLVVTFDTGTPPAACRPRVIRLLIDDDDHGFPPVAQTIPLRRLGRQSIAIPQPRALRSQPTSVQASTGTAPEMRGPAARVMVVR
jgi:hypothetical protein